MGPGFAWLSAAELQLLRRFARGFGKPAVADPHFTALVRCDFVKIRNGGPSVTFLGYARLIIELTRATWIEPPHGARP